MNRLYKSTDELRLKKKKHDEKDRQSAGWEGKLVRKE